MAEALSAETTAILDRLKREGNLLRNTDNNSIKTVIKQFDKFLPAFESINKTLGSIDESVRTMVGRVQEGAFETAAQSQNVNVAESLGLTDEYVQLQTRAAELSIRNDLADEERREKEEAERKQKESDERRQKEAKERIDYLREKTLTGQALTNPLSFFTKLLKGAAVAFVGFNVVRGIVDQWTGGKFTKFIEEIDYEGIGKGIKQFTSFLSDSPWLAFAAGLSAWAAIDFGLPVATAVVGEALRTAVFTNALGRIGGAAAAGGDAAVGGIARYLNVGGIIKGSVFTLLGIAATFATSKLIEKIRTDMMGMTPSEVARAEADPTFLQGTANALSYAAGGATIGSMFGLKGAAIGAVVGFLFGAGAQALESMKDNAERGLASEDVQDAVYELTAIREKIEQRARAKKNMLDAGFEGSEAELEAALDASYGSYDELLNDLNKYRDTLTFEIIDENNRINDKVAKLKKSVSMTYTYKGQQKAKSAERLEREFNERDEQIALLEKQLKLNLAKGAEFLTDEQVALYTNALADLAVARANNEENIFTQFARVNAEKTQQEKRNRTTPTQDAIDAENEILEGVHAFLDEQAAKAGLEIQAVVPGRNEPNQVGSIVVTGGNQQNNIDARDQSKNQKVQTPSNIAGMELSNGERLGA